MLTPLRSSRSPLPRMLLFVSFVSAAVLLSGCGIVQWSKQEPEPRLTPAMFESRLAEFEQHVASQCKASDNALEAHRNETAMLTADVRELGSLLRQLHSDIKLLDVDPQRPPTLCDPDDEMDSYRDKQVLGRSEWVGFPDIGTYLKARIDSGANTSSISARDITPFERDGEDWVRFKLALDDDQAVVEDVRDAWIEAPVERQVRIMQASGTETRPVISLLMTLGPIREHVDFTLSDRRNMSFPILLGRRFMMDIAIVDVAENYRYERPEFPGGEPSDQAAKDEARDAEYDEE
ncbi:ATP-dependent zinc protease family protein [Aidingimonas lacisalsi]|uniref:ATP-dependent zinc protease family protein n=1 Tax=Aidingimonas lacisalsi TaxID=2604086 RepID=UPI001F3AEA9F|nr:ATP-dependent zinc protease [Aidingimonas lacisalsi]